MQEPRINRRKQNNYWNSFKGRGREFENALEELFRDLGHDVRGTPGSGDEGIDLKIEKENLTYLIQCKAHTNPVGAPDIQKFIGASSTYGKKNNCSVKAWFFSLSGYTKRAFEEAEHGDISLFEIDGIIELQKDLSVDTFNSHFSVDDDKNDAVFGYNLFENGKYKIEQGDYEGAINDFDRFIDSNPRSSLAYNLRGVSYANLDKYDEARHDLDMAIKLDPTNPEFYEDRGTLKCNLGDHVAALEDFNIVLELNPNDASVYAKRGLTICLLGDIEGARKDVRKAIELNPADADTYRGYLGKYWGEKIDFFKF